MTRRPGWMYLLLLLQGIGSKLQIHALLPRTLQPSCQHAVLRQEWRELRPAQQGAYLKAVNALKLRELGNASIPARWNHDQFVQAHLDMQKMAHFEPVFFPW
jgi:hypothetical protein